MDQVVAPWGALYHGQGDLMASSEGGKDADSRDSGSDSDSDLLEEQPERSLNWRRGRDLFHQIPVSARPEIVPWWDVAVNGDMGA